jgi:hypothetical protein
MPIKNAIESVESSAEWINRELKEPDEEAESKSNETNLMKRRVSSTNESNESKKVKV